MDEQPVRPDVTVPPDPPRGEDPPLQAAAAGDAAALPAQDSMQRFVRLEQRLAAMEEGNAAGTAKLVQLEQQLQKALRVNQQLQRFLEVAARQSETLGARVAKLDAEPTQGDAFTDVFIAKITGFDVTAGLYKWTEQASISGTTLGDFTNGRTCTSATNSFLGGAAEINGWRNIPNDTLVLVVETPDLSAYRYHLMVTIPKPPSESANYVLTYDGSTKKMVWFTAATASPTTLGSSSEGSESADSSSWTRSTDPLDAWITCRMVYNDAGDEKLYEFRRKFSFNAAGMLVAVSGETRVTTDTPDACT